MKEEDISLIEMAAEQRYPHSDSNDLYFNSVQNSKRGDFCDGAIWFAEHAKPVWARMYDALVKIAETYEPEDAEDNEIFDEVYAIIDEAQKCKINKKKFIHPTYPIKRKKINNKTD